ncbi:MAG: site-specific DNA-methyltransferase [Thermoplasmata archaeon]|nr:site-specific DNA-methyltransferase [Thermoplasmata archaeon]
MTELIWEGKYAADGSRIPAFRVALPFQTVETANESAQVRQKTLDRYRQHGPIEWRNRLIWGDNKYVVPSLLPELAGKIDVIYIDPPFATGQDFSFKVEVGGQEFRKEASIIEQKAYRDTWGRGFDSYLKMIYDRLSLMRELLSETGSVFVHLDYRVAPYVRCILDEVFERRIINEIAWCYSGPVQQKIRNLPTKHDTIFWFAKGPDYKILKDNIRIPYDQQTVDRVKYRGPGGFVRPKGTIELDARGKIPEDWWKDIPYLNAGVELTGYPTQKPARLLRRIIELSSEPGDLVADFFCGSGTTLAMAEELGRRWIGCDLSRFATHVTRKRLLGNPKVSPFAIQNLGKYERQVWQMSEFGDSAESRVASYREFILRLFRAESLQGFSWLHGARGNRMVHVGSVDSPVTEEDVTETVKEFEKLIGKGRLAPSSNGIDVLGWDFAFEVNEVSKEQARGKNVDVRFRRIPRDILDKRAIEEGDVRFFELAALSVKAITMGKTVSISIDDFVIPPDDVPEEVRHAVTHWKHWLDYWAIDWDNKGDAFHNEWQDFRSREKPELTTNVSHTYAQKGRFSIVVKAIDILGNDTTKSLFVSIA